MSIFSSIVETITKPVSDYFTRRMELKSQERQQEAAIKQATVERQIDLIKQGLTADMNWEMAFANQAATSYKDELELLVITIPAVLCFFPKGAALVAAGFEALSHTPAWYQFLFISIYLANYGIRYWRKTQSDT